MPAIKRILSVSRDRAIMLARNDALAVSGFSVVSPRHPEEATQILATSNVDIIILGHSIPFEERAELQQAFQRIAPTVPVIVLYDDAPDLRETADAFVSIHAGPEELIQAIHSCLSDLGKRASG